MIVSIPIPIPKVVGQSVPELGRTGCGVAVGPLAISRDVAVGAVVAVAIGVAVAVGVTVAQEQVVLPGQDGFLQYPL
jgi:hypothetical protein